MKKPIAMLIISALLAATLAGCNEETESKQNSSSESSQTQSSSSQESNSSTTSETNESSSQEENSSSAEESSSSIEENSSSSVEESSSSQSSSSSSSKPQSSSTSSSSKPQSSSSSSTNEQKWTESEFVASIDMIVKSNGVNARSKPFADSTPIKVYNKGEIVQCIADTDNKYYKLKNGGYIHEQYLEPTDEYKKPVDSSSSSSSSSSTPIYTKVPDEYLPDGSVNPEYLTYLRSRTIKTDRPIPEDASKETLEMLSKYSCLNDEIYLRVIKESWDLNIGDTTFQGYKIIGKTPEGFGYIATDKDTAETGAYIAGYNRLGRIVWVYDEKVNKEYWDNLNISIG